MSSVIRALGERESAMKIDEYSETKGCFMSH